MNVVHKTFSEMTIFVTLFTKMFLQNIAENGIEKNYFTSGGIKLTTIRLELKRYPTEPQASVNTILVECYLSLNTRGVWRFSNFSLLRCSHQMP